MTVRLRGPGRMSPGVYEIGDRPSSSGKGSMIDGHLRESAPGGNFPGGAEWVYDTGAAGHRVGLAAWHLKEWRGMTVVDVSLFLFLRFHNGLNAATECFSCQDPFLEDEATWDEPHDGGAWTGGTDPILDTSFGRIARLTTAQTGAPQVDTWIEFTGADLKSFVQSVLNGNGPDSWWSRFVFFNDIGSGTDVRFRAREAATFPLQRPYMLLEVDL